jgi:hypothetical protein
LGCHRGLQRFLAVPLIPQDELGGWVFYAVESLSLGNINSLILLKRNKEAERFYGSGPPVFQRHLPFWVANFLARVIVMLVPVFASLYPLFKLMPPIYKWRMRSRLYRWHSELEAVDPEIQKDFVAERLEEYLVELNKVEKQVSNISIPPAHAEGLYDLR